jgi:hypothetical protein
VKEYIFINSLLTMLPCWMIMTRKTMNRNPNYGILNMVLYLLSDEYNLFSPYYIESFSEQPIAKTYLHPTRDNAG